MVRLALGGLALLPAGCASIHDVATRQRIYGGVREDVDYIANPILPSAHGGVPFWPLAIPFVLDLPLSAVLDTALLPVTIIVGMGRAPEARPQPVRVPEAPSTREVMVERRRSNLARLESGGTPQELQIAVNDLALWLGDPDFSATLSAFLRIAGRTDEDPSLRWLVIRWLIRAPQPLAFEAAIDPFRRGGARALSNTMLRFISEIALNPESYRESLRGSLGRLNPGATPETIEGMLAEALVVRRLKLLGLLDGAPDEVDPDLLQRTKKAMIQPW